ncbi:MAG: type 1 glutamine amidotransferase domain-containing protein, partial [Gammaproteobacteria bacterium]
LADGSLLIKGRKVTGFSNEEEALVDLDKVVPLLTETEPIARGAVFEKADRPWASFAVEDNRVITGQNPASASAVADLLIAALQRNR